MDDQKTSVLKRITRAIFRRSSDQQPLQTSGDAANDDVPLHIELRDRVLSEADALLYRSMTAALAADAIVLAKVRLADFLRLPNGGKQLKFAIQMDRKWVDFVLCDPDSMQPLAVVQRIEASDGAQKTAVSQHDRFISETLHHAGIRLLRIQTRSHYRVDELRDLILPKIIDDPMLASSNRISRELDRPKRTIIQGRISPA